MSFLVGQAFLPVHCLNPMDRLTILMAVAVLANIALLASCLPARQLEPMKALREE
jgi:hypothetical protein